MPYTEVQRRGKNQYYYRTKSVRVGANVKKIRRFLGKNLSQERRLALERQIDQELDVSLSTLLSSREIALLEKMKREHKPVNHEFKYDHFVAKFTYDSNAIEGNTLTLKETSLILFDHITPSGKSLREINEVTNHKEAFDFILYHTGLINKKFICEIQRIITKNTVNREDLKSQIGKYRTVQVYIRGSDILPPKPSVVPGEMQKLLSWHKRNDAKLHPFIVAAYVHVAFEAIHPFFDGNGRTGRLLMDFILHKHGFPMINIPNKNKLDYYVTLEKAQKGDFRAFITFLLGIIKDRENLY